ncbi:MAG: DNA-processing protein DprA, partial [Eggerthellaceae bacterium]|nr:DNA-processing protein DprA [Eggerthellaceae bacterium]
MYRLYNGASLKGERHVIAKYDPAYPEHLAKIPYPPQTLYVIGDPASLTEGIGIIGARKATPYGLSCAAHFAERAALKGVVVISGGAHGCDSRAHRGALDAGG